MASMDAALVAKRADFANALRSNPLWGELMEDTRQQIMAAWLHTTPEQVAVREAAYARCRTLVDLNTELLRWANAGAMLARTDEDSASPSA